MAPSDVADRNLTVKIHRYNPELDDAPHWEQYTIAAHPMDRVLDVLQNIKWYQDETLSLRRSCAHGVCGSDAMRINGFNCSSACPRDIQVTQAIQEVKRAMLTGDIDLQTTAGHLGTGVEKS